MTNPHKALAIGNAIRLQRTAFRREVKANPSLALQAISNPPSFMQNASLTYLLKSVTRIGPKYIERFCDQARVKPSKKLGELTVRQRLRLVELLQDSRCFRSLATLEQEAE